MERAGASSSATIARVFDLQEVTRSSGSLICRGQAEWSDGRVTAPQMEATDTKDGVSFRYGSPSSATSDGPTPTTVGGDPGQSDEQGPGDDVRGGGIPFDPSTANCEQIRAEVVAMSQRDRISRGFALLKIYDPELVSQRPDRLTCRGRAAWTNGLQSALEYGFFQDSEGEYILTYRDLESEQRVGGQLDDYVIRPPLSLWVTSAEYFSTTAQMTLYHGESPNHIAHDGNGLDFKSVRHG
jgi:hypothetical protein